jgi:EmrB/QacA subfamily drug resistance transporter
MTRRQILTLLATIIGSGVVLLDGTVINLALPALNKDLGVSFSGLQWVVDGYLLSLSALMLLGGSLGDILGRKRVYIVGLVGFGISSIMCGLAPDITFLIMARILQGVFGALVVPGALAIINANFEPQKRGKAIGIWAAWSGIAAAIGPLLGGYIIDTFSWRWVFFINIPFILMCLALAVPNIKESVVATVRRIDFLGGGVAVLFLGAITFGLIEGPVRHWDILSLSSIAAGLVLGALFIFIESRLRDPMVPLGLFSSRNFTGANIMTFAMYGALGGFFFALVIYLQNTLHYSSLQAGATLIPVTLVLLLFSGKMGALTTKFGPRLFMTVGPFIAALGMLLLLPLSPGANYVLQVLPGILLFATGLCIVVTPLTVTVMGSVADERSGIASGINNAVSRAAGLIIVALLGIVGAQDMYWFSVLLCVGLTVAAGVVSFFLIENPKSTKAAGQ